MLTVQSAYSGEALVVTDNVFSIYRLRDGSYCQIEKSDANRWLRSHGEVRHVEVSDLFELSVSLKQYHERRIALTLALFSIDRDLSASIHERSARLLSELLCDDSTNYWLQDLFCIHSIPEESVKAAKLIREEMNGPDLSKYREFIGFIINKRESIKIIADVWLQLENANVFGENHSKVMDSILGTRLFTSIVSQGLEVTTGNLLLLTSLKAKSNVNKQAFDIVKNIDLDFLEVAGTIGLADAVNGVDYFDLWEHALSRLNSHPYDYINIGLSSIVFDGKSPTSMGSFNPVGSNDLVIWKGKECAPVPKKLYNQIESNLLLVEASTHKDQYDVEFSVFSTKDPEAQKAYEILRKWHKFKATGALEELVPKLPFQIKGSL